VKGEFAEFGILRRHIDMGAIAEQIKERWCIVCYLIINWRVQELVEKAQWEIPVETYEVLATHLYNYVYKDEMPPVEIASTILNVADDFMRGKRVELRAGDYIALQGFVRSDRM
jgi:hypothetical protein